MGLLLAFWQAFSALRIAMLFEVLILVWPTNVTNVPNASNYRKRKRNFGFVPLYKTVIQFCKKMLKSCRTFKLDFQSFSGNAQKQGGIHSLNDKTPFK